MVETNKQENDSSPKTLPVAHTGGDRRFKLRRRISFGKPSKKSLLYLLLAIIVLIGAWIILRKEFHVGEKVYAQAAGHRVYKPELQSIMKQKGVSQRDAATALADKYLSEAMAKKAGIKISNQDINSAYGSYINKLKSNAPYSYQTQVNALYFNKLQDTNTGVYVGKLLVAHFSRYIPNDTVPIAQQQAINPKIGNVAAIAADKKYAQDFIDSLYTRIQAHEISFNEAIQLERNDPSLGKGIYQTLSHSGSFDTSSRFNTRNGLIGTPSAWQKVSKMKAGQLSKPFVVKVAGAGTGNHTVESYYLVVQMDSVSGHSSGLNFEQYLTQSKKQFKYKVNV